MRYQTVNRLHLRNAGEDSGTVFTGSHILPFFESGTETAFTVEAGAESDLLNGHIRSLQQELGRVDPGGDQILMRRKTGLGGEYPGKMVGAHVGVPGHSFQGKGFAEMFTDIGQGVFHDLRMGKIIAGIGTDIQQGSQYLSNISGHHGFTDRFRIPEQIQDLGHIMGNRVEISGGYDIAVAGGDQLIVIPGEGTVKMKPGYFSVFRITVFVWLIAVQKEELILGNDLHLPLEPDLAGAFYHMHQQEAVIACALQMVTGFIIKITKNDRIKIDPGGNGAWLIKVIIGIGRDHSFFGTHNFLLEQFL